MLEDAIKGVSALADASATGNPGQWLYSGFYIGSEMVNQAGSQLVGSASLDMQFSDIQIRQDTASHYDPASGGSALISATTSQLTPLAGGSGSEAAATSPVGSLAYIDTIDAAEAARLYRAAFDRAPDTAGLAAWTDALQQGGSLVGIAGSFLATAEAQADYGGADNAEFATRLYENVLGRAPNSSGLAYWTDQLDSGSATRAQVLVDFSESIESQVATPDETTASVARLYFVDLGRAPDASGLSYWTSALAGGTASLEDEATALANSGEFISTYGHLDDAGFVARMYQNVLGRAGDAAGVSFWTDTIAAGASRGSVAVDFSESAEFKARFVSTIAANGIPLSGH